MFIFFTSKFFSKKNESHVITKLKFGRKSCNLTILQYGYLDTIYLIGGNQLRVERNQHFVYYTRVCGL